MLRRLLPGFIWIACLNASVQAELQFEFIETKSNLLLAELSLAELSSDPNDVLSLTFSLEGQERFGLTPVYKGTFDGLTSADEDVRLVTHVDEFGRVGLGAEGNNHILSTGIYDLNPPETLLEGITMLRFDVAASSGRGPTDRFVLNFVTDEGERGNLQSAGNWLLVPEPNAIVVVFFGGAALMTLRSRRRRSWTSTHG